MLRAQTPVQSASRRACPSPCATAQRPSFRPAAARPARVRSVVVRASDNPVRTVLGGIVSGIYKASASMQAVEPGLSPLWAAVKKLDLAGVKSAAQSGSVNETDASGDTPLLYIARQGHYKYPPAEIPQALVSAGADLEARDRNGLTALQVSLLAGWQNIAELLIKSGADTSGVPAIKSRLTCPDCKALVAKYQLA